MPFIALAVAALALQAAALPEGAPGAVCQPQPIAEIPVIMRGARQLRPVVAAKINGMPVRMMLDTGASMTMVYKTSAERLGLATAPMPPGARMTSSGQPIDVSVGLAKRITFGPRDERDATVVVGEDEDYQSWLDGLLGQPELGGADIEFDFAHGAIRLFSPDDCANTMPAYWAAPGQAVGTVELEPRSQQKRPFGRITINGTSLRALFDTGAPTTDLTVGAAARAGVAPGARHVVAAGTGSGIGGKMRLKNWRGLFHKVDLGGEVMTDVTLDFTEKPNAEADLLIGADYFTTHRIFMSRSRNKLYATPVGKGGLAAQPKAPPP